jgi:16S rRNA (guanine1516-N2)-methyltransferase
MLLVTTSYDPTTKETEEAVAVATSLSTIYVNRGRASLGHLFEQYTTDSALIVSKKGLRYENRDGQSFFFHPNLSIIRLKQWAKGENDAMVQASQLTKGDQVLDCTLGMGSDAIVASFVVGDSGKVVGLESEPVLSEIVCHGLKAYESGHTKIDEAMKRIEVVHTNYQSYLDKCPANSFDVVMFDPMFRKTVTASHSMQSLKSLANPIAVDDVSIEQACRVARRSVLLKERRNSHEFTRLGFTIVHRSSSFAWGVKHT